MNNIMDSRIAVYYGIDGYIKSMELRVADGIKEIRQIVSGDKVAKFHKASNYLVKDIIAKRVENKIKLNNLISYGDDKLEIERSNKLTLKEARVLPNKLVANNMIAVFNDTITITSLDIENSYTVVIKDELTSKFFSLLFDIVWQISKKV